MTLDGVVLNRFQVKMHVVIENTHEHCFVRFTYICLWGSSVRKLKALYFVDHGDCVGEEGLKVRIWRAVGLRATW